jgi:transcriptional regulator with XRE-family HTH domain
LAEIQINRIKTVLVETRIKSKWLAEQLGKDTSTISQWNNNKRQPSLENLFSISKILNVDIRELLISTKKKTIKE